MAMNRTVRLLSVFGCRIKLQFCVITHIHAVNELICIIHRKRFRKHKGRTIASLNQHENLYDIFILYCQVFITGDRYD